MDKQIKKILVANRGEIAIRIFRACSELGIRSVAIYSKEDKYSLFRTKADESYLIGEKKSPVDAYLAIDEIIHLALKKGVDAIHPGYGFLSENPYFAEKCEEAGIVFIGPNSEMIVGLGDKIQSKILAKKANVPTIPGVDKPIANENDALEFAKECGYPVMIKAAAGGGGRGMRIVYQESDLISEFNSAKSEAKKAFGIDDMFIEKYLNKPKHIEVQILGDNYGNIVHLYERDCSIQRRHQKIIEFAPAFSINEELRDRICQDAIKLAGSMKYRSAGTVEFLVDSDNHHYFIEMNPRIQVEHTVSEIITGIDIVQSQILIAQGYTLDSKEIGIPSQESIETRGYAIQCRVTTEDPANNFAPDTGRLEVYRSSSGFGIRLDGGNGYTGAQVSPYYDSLLVKIIAYSRTFEDASRKAIRSLKDTTIKGVKTNTAFLINVINHPTFRQGKCDTGFLDHTPGLFNIRPSGDRETKILRYIGEKVVNEVKGTKKDFDTPLVPSFSMKDELKGTKQLLDERGPDKLADWIKSQDKLLLTDTTFRDAHQSLVATRVRTRDMLKIAEATSSCGNDLFSLEMWGGATFDVSYRYLKESPWRRLERLREKVPNILLQMLIRGSNAVGYKNYPDNVIREFIRVSSERGIDVFRIFDSLNWLRGMEVALDEVLKTGKMAEVSMCYTGDILDEKRDKYSLKYYVEMAKEIENMGAHILGIKDMAGLLKPYASKKLIKALKEEVSIPIHLHTHDTSGNGVSTILMAAEQGVDIVDTAFNSMSGLTSQPALNSVVAALENTKRDPKICLEGLQKLSDYWFDVRKMYEPFESDLKSGTAEIYKYEIPGGQYSNLKPQVESFGLGDRFGEVKETFREVNDLFGDIVKVTPSSKAVGDMAIFMVQNDLDKGNLFEKGKNLNFPDSVVAFFKGMMGQPLGGFPKDLQKLVLKGEEALLVRPGEVLEPEDFSKIEKMLGEELHDEPNIRNILSYALYPKVYKEYLSSVSEYGDLSNLESHVFFYGLKEGETSEVEIEEGKILIIKLVSVGKIDNDGYRSVTFEINGNRREIMVEDKGLGDRQQVVSGAALMADPEDETEIGASIPGTVMKVLVNEGDEVKPNQTVAILEAMKMETNLQSPIAGVVEAVPVKEGQQVKAGQLIIKLG